EIFYTGLDPQEAGATATPGEIAELDISLTSASRYGPEGTVKLDSFVVSTPRETDGEAIAINEQRFAANIKNVVAADARSDVMGGNVGECRSGLRGITAEYDAESGGAVAWGAVRGFPSSMGVLSTGGMERDNPGNPQCASRVL